MGWSNRKRGWLRDGKDMVQNNFPFSSMGFEQKETKETKETKAQVRSCFVSFVFFCSKSNREVVSSRSLRRAFGHRIPVRRPFQAVLPQEGPRGQPGKAVLPWPVLRLGGLVPSDIGMQE